jgi:hypothetical protein
MLFTVFLSCWKAHWDVMPKSKAIVNCARIDSISINRSQALKMAQIGEENDRFLFPLPHTENTGLFTHFRVKRTHKERFSFPLARDEGRLY